jgi:hypothetical protein
VGCLRAPALNTVTPLTYPASNADAQAVSERGCRLARAYREGELVCGRVDLRIRSDARLGLAPRERHQLVARFVELLSPAFRQELEQLIYRRGAAAAGIGTIELVIEDPQRDGQRLVGHLEPPQARRWELSETEFVIRERV